jgi:hypothetical protein
MTIETATFAVTRGGVMYGVTGAELDGLLQDGDMMVLQRGEYQYIFTVSGGEVDPSNIDDDDLFAATDTDGVTYKVTGTEFKALFDTGECVPDLEGYQSCKQQATADYNRCRLLCESSYCLSICEREKGYDMWDCETNFKCADPNRPGARP